MLELILDTIHDTWLMLPLLYITYCILEVFERRQSDESDEKIFFALQRIGPFIGALIGLIPQCGFSVLAAMLFLQRNITLGTLVAVMIATSDEAVPILLSNPELYSTLGFLLLAKFIVALIVGYLVDFLFRNRQKIIRFEDMEEEEEYDEEEEAEETQGSQGGCSCCYPDLPLPVSALYRTIRIFIFLFVTTFVLGAVMKVCGPDTLKHILLSNSVFQPVLAALVGFIPNCAATVILAQLYATGSISLGSLFAGLCTNSGLALLLLIRYGERKRYLARVIGILFITATIVGVGIQAF